MNTRQKKAYKQLIEAFREHGTCWNNKDRDEDRCLWVDGDVEKLLKHEEYFGHCDYTDAQIEAASSIIARAAAEAGNQRDIFPEPDDSFAWEPSHVYFDADCATRELSVPMLDIVEAWH